MQQVMEQVLTQQSQEEKDLILSETLKKTSTAKGLIDTQEKLDSLLKLIEHCDDNIIAFDTETNGTFKRSKIKMVGMSLAFNIQGKKVAFYLPFHHNTEVLTDQLFDIAKSLDKLKVILENDKYEKVAHNAKFDQMVLSQYGVSIKGVLHDTYIMAWLYNESGPRGLKQLVHDHLNYDMVTYEDVIASAPKKRGVARDYNFANVPIENALDYAADDAYYTLELFEYFKPLLKEEGVWKAYSYVESPFGKVLANVEKRGVLVDKKAVDLANEELPKIADEVESLIYNEAGKVFNIGSGQQLGKILYEELGIGNNVKKTKTGNYATDKKTLKQYAEQHEIVKNILRRKKIQKTYSTFVRGIEESIENDGRVHPNFNGCGTVTGRLSCNNPNLQQIEVDEVETVKVRNFFIPTAGHKFIVADYSQIELRVMAHFSKDKFMIESFLSGHDFHEQTRLKMEEITGEQFKRKYAKILNFGAGYGIAGFTIGEMLGIPAKKGDEFVDAWFKAFPGVKVFKEHLLKQATHNGYVRTLTGRKRRLFPEIQSPNWAIRNHAKRQAFNTKIQGSAADIIKLAMIELDKILPYYNAHTIIQVHDELVIECPEEYISDCLHTVKEKMERPFRGKNPLILPLVTEPMVVDRWGDAKD